MRIMVRKLLLSGEGGTGGKSITITSDAVTPIQQNESVHIHNTSLSTRPKRTVGTRKRRKNLHATN